jgi:hypothetical protein
MKQMLSDWALWKEGNIVSQEKLWSPARQWLRRREFSALHAPRRRDDPRVRSVSSVAVRGSLQRDLDVRRPQHRWRVETAPAHHTILKFNVSPSPFSHFIPFTTVVRILHIDCQQPPHSSSKQLLRINVH